MISWKSINLLVVGYDEVDSSQGKESIYARRSWVEDEAKKSHARAKVLEEVGRRWRWE